MVAERAESVEGVPAVFVGYWVSAVFARWILEVIRTYERTCMHVCMYVCMYSMHACTHTKEHGGVLGSEICIPTLATAVAIYLIL